MHGVILRPPALSLTTSFREAYAARRFDQRELVEVSELIREARELGVFVSEERLQELDRAGVFTPIAFGREEAYGHALGSRWNVDGLTFRDEVGFRGWNRYRFIEERRRRPSLAIRRMIVLYSPWQLLYLKSAAENAWEPISRKVLLGRQESLARVRMNFRPIARVHQQWWLATEAHWRPLVLLLSWLQNRYLPYVTGVTTRLLDPVTHDYYDPLPAEIEAFDAPALLTRFGLSVSEVKATYEQLASFARAVDPIEDWFLVVRAAKHSAHSRFTGDARLAQLGYDGAGILRRYLADLTGDVPPDADEVMRSPGEWKERLLGHEDELFYSREDFKRILECKHLSPYGVHVFVEGVSDRALIAGLIDALWGDHRALGVRFTVLGGTGEVARSTALFEAFSTYARFALLVADDEGKIERDLQRLRSDGLLVSDEALHRWRRNIEEDNASLSELVEIANAITAGRGQPLGLTAAKLRRIRAQSKTKGAASAIVEHARQKGITLRKEEIAIQIRERVLEELQEADLQEVVRHRPILALTETLARYSANL